MDQVCTVEHYPREDDSTHITSISVQGGGAVATACVASSRLGVPTAFIGNIGYDRISDSILEEFAKDGVATDAMVKRTDCFGLQSFVMVNPATGSRTKFPQRDTNPVINWTEDLAERIRNAQILHLDGTNWENAIRASEIAKQAGVLVSLDGCSMQRDNQKNRTLASMADFLIMNQKYPLRVSGESSLSEAMLEMATWGPKVVVGTLGKLGCVAVIDGSLEKFDAYPVSSVVDTTGAGDVFHGAFISAYLEEMDIRSCIWFASVAAALKCTRIGGRAGIPTKEEVLAVMRQSIWPKWL